ncbi:MAG: Flp pilus assembly protein CpaB [Candidatus Omnitrophica bacterium]|nr:Flp pilus assembly protein CpaB [Candidatus Omnitrophota bacterium]
MALFNAGNKVQFTFIAVAIAAGVVASVLVGNVVTSMVNEGTTKLANQYQKAQEENKAQYQQDIASLNQKIVEVQASANKAAQEAVKMAASQKAAVTTAAAEAPKKKPSLALRTPAGKRALTVELQSLGAVGGLLNPGDFVDVIAHLDMPTGKKLDPKEKVTAMIFQGLQVLAINTNIDEPGAYEFQQKEKALKVTFAVDPQEAGLLAFADLNGKLELALRTPTEKGRPMIPTANWSTLGEYVLENSGADIKLQTEEPVARKAELSVETESAVDAKPYIQIYRGGREL